MQPSSHKDRRLEGVASGFDTGALVDQAIKLQKLPVLRLEDKARKLEHQLSWLDEIAYDCQDLRTTLQKMDSIHNIAPLGAKLDSPHVRASCRDEAVAGSYSLEFSQVARRQRWYSRPWRVDPEVGPPALAHGQLSLTRNGDQKTYTCALGPSRKPDDVAADIRAAGLGIDAQVASHIDEDLLAYNQAHPDEQAHAYQSLQLSALLPGLAQGFSAQESYEQAEDADTGLRLQVDAHLAVAPQDTHLFVDQRAIAAASATGEVRDAVRGVTLQISEQLRVPSRLTLRIEVDARSLRGHVEDFIKAYNKAMKTLYRATVRPPTTRRIGGQGNSKTISQERAAQEQSETLNRERRPESDLNRANLHDDVSLRLFFDSMIRIISAPIIGAKPYSTVAEIGIEPNREGLRRGQQGGSVLAKAAADGTLALSRATFDRALVDAPQGVAQIIAGDPTIGIKGISGLLEAELFMQMSVAQGVGFARQRMNEELNLTLDQRDLKNEQLERVREQESQRFRQLEDTMAKSKTTTAYLGALGQGGRSFG